MCVRLIVGILVSVAYLKVRSPLVSKIQLLSQICFYKSVDETLFHYNRLLVVILRDSYLMLLLMSLFVEWTLYYWFSWCSFQENSKHRFASTSSRVQRLTCIMSWFCVLSIKFNTWFLQDICDTASSNFGVRLLFKFCWTNVLGFVREECTSYLKLCWKIDILHILAKKLILDYLEKRWQ